MRKGTMNTSGGRARRVAAGLTGLLVTAGLAGPGMPASADPGPGPNSLVHVIVRTGSAEGATAARQAVTTGGGTVGAQLAVISGFEAQVPRHLVPTLRAEPYVAAVTVDAPVRLEADQWANDGAPPAPVDKIKAAAGGLKNDKTINTAALTGAGIGVALIDSGVAPVPGLNQPGKVINGPDLSFESQTPGLQDLDTFGHGTHMAGIIAGSDPATAPGSPRFDGIAPGAHLISIKVAAADGASDVSQVIAAIDWAVAHRNDPGLNIRVLNLSFGTDSAQSEILDPLSYAVEAAWNKGIVVVAAVGNDGPTTTRVNMPAANPYVIAVGAADTNGTDSRADDTVASFSDRGTAARHADLLATGRSVVSLRDPGSYIDTNYPAARVADSTGQQRFFRGSGTSQATAVMSGSVALLLQQRPNLTPDQVKAILIQTADPIPGADPLLAGAGQVDIARAAALAAPPAGPATGPTPPGAATQKFPAATGLGTLEGSRGTAHVTDAATGLALSGEKDIFGKPWTPASWTKAAKSGNAWTGGTWNGSTWSGNGFTGSSWTTQTWATTTWATTTWTGQSWSANTWSGRSWTAGTWTGRSWTTGTWTGRSWTGRSWG